MSLYLNEKFLDRLYDAEPDLEFKQIKDIENNKKKILWIKFVIFVVIL